MRALVTGGSGFVGSHIVRRLLDDGAKVRALVRASSPLDNFADLDVDVTVGDLRDRNSLVRAVAGCDTVFHCAADYRLYARDPSQLYASNVDGTDNILAAAAEAGVDKVVYTSSVGTLATSPDDSVADEETPVTLEEVLGHYKRSKFKAERVAEAWAAKGLPVVIVNPSTPVGERDIKPTATGQIIVDFLKGRIPAYVDSGLNLVDVRDVAAGHLLAAAKGRVGEKYILGHRNMELREVFATLADLTDLPKPTRRLPHWLPIGVAAIDTALARLLHRQPRVALEAARLARYKMYFDPAKAVRELGLPQTPVEEPLRRAIDWFRRKNYV
ncbi:MAG: hopanoid-associated sugar epimerase [Acidobacteriota bacterium]